LKRILLALMVWTAPLLAFAGDCVVELTCFSGPVTVVVPFPPGTTSDIVARLWAAQLASQLGQPVLVANEPGARGMVATPAVGKLTRDGKTILVTNSHGLLIAPHLYRAPVDSPMTDIVPVAQLALAAQVLVVLSDAPYKNLQEFVGHASIRSCTYGSSAAGSLGHWLGQRLVTTAGAAHLEHVAFRGVGAALGALRAGKVDSLFTDLGSVLADLKRRKLRALAVSGDRRSALAPDIPTFAEQGVPGIQSAWVAAFLRAGTDPAIVNRLNAESRSAMASPEVQSRLRQASLEGSTLDLATFARAMATESAAWTTLVKKSGTKLE
jgi:tripartite-type tricarboxylate transporter receptor subunit TctC